ncbi:alcohol dehydrogenase catalytic domain-containing protein [Arthrobacter sp. ISL-48]|uniref:zinc-dependent alcohol dehydrogenase n=1 Tax=Arthrobacter sp. ISL-48 TaxID=2819110 RepID=UPI001BEC6957|nr:alcohol dehydrogenase catalytic domain-containing protein [Arthrobacter sp. ISL-48]MBT2533972.1 alcohol dehydrogenase catalytic domain-containing protein [Arthrobacter sp. ISL-48]
MRALKYADPWDLRLVEVETLHALRPHDVVVDIHYCGICGTDLGIASGFYPVAQQGVTIGHEATGIVAEVGEKVTNAKVGDRVVINPTPFCGACRMCESRRTNHCTNKMGTESGVSYDGAFADRFLTTQEYVHVLPEDVSLKAAALTEPLACVLGGVRQLDLSLPSPYTFVFGAGPLGLLYVWALSLRGVLPIVIERSEARLRSAGPRLPKGAKIYRSLEEARRSHFHDPEAPLDLVIDTTSGMLMELYPQLACGSTFLSVGLKTQDATIDALQLADRSLTILGSIDSRDGSFSEAFNLIASGLLPAEKLISDVISLEDYERAFSTLGCDIRNQQLGPAPDASCKVLLSIGGE